MATIKLSEQEWDRIYLQIKEEYKTQPSVYMIRPRMREVLGFTDRLHRYWKLEEGIKSYEGYGSYVTEIHVDFYSESAETMFRLKYL